jgi:PAS domain S-box-containing protein
MKNNKENKEYIKSSTVPDEYWERYSDGVVAIDKNLKIISFSLGAERILGYSAEEVTGKTCKQVFRSRICEKSCVVKRILETEESVSNIREDIKNANNETITVSVNGSPLHNIHGETVGAILILRNVSEVYKLSAELFKESIRLRSILNSIADGVFTVDTNWLITSFNPSAEKITGYKKKEVLGKSCKSILKAHVCNINCPLRKTLESGKTITNFETYITGASGKKIPVSVNTSMLIDEKREIIGGVETFRDLSTIKHLKDELEGRYKFGKIVGKNPEMQKIYNLIESVSNTNSTVLILGETGTGKDLVARAIHYNSPRKDENFIKVSCAALPETLLESELFGHSKGAFTGAVRNKPGRFQLADKGTIFLDEVGEIPTSIQVKLLRVLEENAFEPLGSNQSVRVDVRIIAATNRDLKKALQEGTFREDLYYRLNVIPISLPPLRDRKDDIPLLVDHFIKKLNNKTNRNIVSVSRKAMEKLLDNRWTGNVRQLENAIEYAFLHCDGKRIEVNHLPQEIREDKEKILEPYPHRTIKETEKEIIKKALIENNFNKKETASILGISRTTLWRKMKKYKIKED